MAIEDGGTESGLTQDQGAHSPDRPPTEAWMIADIASAFTFASHQNAVPVLRALTITNLTPRDLTNCRLDVSAQPPFLRPRSWTIDRLAAGDDLTLGDRRLDLDPGYLAGLNEAERGEISFVLRQGDAILAQTRSAVRLLARDEWGGVGDMAQLLPAFVMPNDPAVQTLLRAASDRLAARQCEPGMDGYQSADPRRVRLLVAALYSAIAAQNTFYAEPPASFEERGQKIRGPSTIAKVGLATCLDSTLLFAAAFEAAGLNPVLLMFDGHAAVGVWLVKRTLPDAITGDPSEVRKALAAGEMMVLETTAITRRPVASLEQAQSALLPRLSEEQEAAFHLAIDVRRLRDGGIAPLATHGEGIDGGGIAGPHTGGVGGPGLPVLDGWPDGPVRPEPQPLEPKPRTAQDRIARWQKKLLDLTLRNRLLNFRDGKKTVPFLCTDVAYLEDRLAAGAGIRILSLPQQNPLGERDAQTYRDMRGEDVHRRFAAEALERDELPSPLAARELEGRLIDLYREVRNDLAEGGTNTLFLAVGFLRWRRPGEQRTYRAPLLLVPVKLERTAATSRFTLRFHEDDPRFNATLLRFLEEEFELSLPQLEGDLPTDDSGVDVPRLLAEVRRAVRDVPGMEVVDETALATFSFAKYLMWKDLVDRTDLLRQNRVVRHLIDTPDAPFPGLEAPPPEARDLDRLYAPSDIVNLLPADSSQSVASLMAAQGHDMVLIGPPGTGKSQTIANMIAHCLSVGKTVLFVAEKAAALSVVYRRLREHGLAPHCLELHSSKTDRKSFLAQLKASWEHGGAVDESAWLSANHDLGLRRDELNAYVEALHRAHANGLTLYQALGRVLRDEGEAAPALAFAGPDAHDATSLKALEELAEALGRTFAAVGTRPALGVVQATDWSNAWQQQLLAAALALKSAAETLATAQARFRSALGLASDGTARLADISRFAALAEALAACAHADHSIAFDPDFDALPSALQQLAATLTRLRAVEAQVAGRFTRAEVPRIPLDEIEPEWRRASAAFWPLRLLRQSQIRNLLATYAASGKPEPRDMLPLLRQMQALITEVEASPLAVRPVGFAGADTNVESIAALLRRAQALRQAVFALPLSDAEVDTAGHAFTAMITTGADPSGVAAAGQTLTAALVAFNARAEAFAGVAECPLSTLLAGDAPAGIARAMAELVEARTALADWTSWQGVRRLALAHGLAPLVEALETRLQDPATTANAFRLAYARWWLPLAMDADPVLRRFRRYQHEHTIADFRRLDDLARSHAADHVRRRIAHQLPAVQSVPRNSELGLLRHQTELQRPSKSIRDMIGAMPQNFSKLAPCMLMSPLSIAQYLPAGHALFDVVIFDEASQITTWDAVGAIARGRQTVIVGDPKQLPPTNFFGRNDDDEDIEEAQRDLESILDEARASGLPMRQLNWHYRSRHEALIAFSNQHYYGNRLITFPSPEVEDRAVRLHAVADGIYDRGKSRTNLIEARALVEAAVARMRTWASWPDKARPTLGIITFNAQQQALIQDLLDAARAEAPEIEWFFSDERFEPTIVKNLENVQGDERDVMFFSITFTKDAAGVRRMDFGALNRDGGERRLNVAITRARQELVVFSGTRADDIDVARTKGLGVHHLKTFLDFAARGAVALAGQDRGSLGGPDSPFEEAVADALTARGWQLVPQVGVSAFRIDLGVKHPDKAGTYLAGIECDGATYHRSTTARDRDRVREDVLRGLGWEILRVWSTDWWLNREEAVNRLDAALVDLVTKSRAAQPEAAEPAHWNLGETVDPASDEALPPGAPTSPETPPATDEEDTLGEVVPLASEPLRGATSAFSGPPLQDVAAMTGSPGTPAYQMADLSGFSADPERFFEDDYAPRLTAMVEAVIAAEAPVREDVLAQRIARAHGWLRTGKRIKAQIALHLGPYERTREPGGDFLWRVGSISPRVAFRAPASSAARRSLDEIPEAELLFVACSEVRLADESDPPLTLARRLGIDRLTAANRLRLQEILARATDMPDADIPDAAG
ncbi:MULTISPECIES: DUF3320 domain-containing protein [unclassified Xanthobacter]|uniref:DUF3320 domain-containing protein n=1 Tax=unclassified Xanthobacter TaxID=2623496 RepID=UPI001EDE3EBA|nr:MULTISPECIES: DUF3320 domain-containing protein [unclassified Xanthobacter]